MRLPPVFAAYCLLILLAFSLAKYEGWALFGSTGQAARTGATGGSRSFGSSGFHK